MPEHTTDIHVPLTRASGMLSTLRQLKIGNHPAQHNNLTAEPAGHPTNQLSTRSTRSTFQLSSQQMCFQTTCGSCGKPTWSGCGGHIDSALRSVPMDARCSCKPRSAAEQASWSSRGRMDAAAAVHSKGKPVLSSSSTSTTGTAAREDYASGVTAAAPRRVFGHGA